MFKVEKQFKVIIRSKSGIDSVYTRPAFNLTGIKRYVTQNLVSAACGISIYWILNPQSAKENWTVELLATRDLTEDDIEWGITSETAKWVNW